MTGTASAQTTPEIRELTWDNVLSWRMARQHLLRRRPASARLDVISDLCGLHAQVMSSAELTLLARIEDLAPGMVADMLWEDRTLVKTWGVRGTLHLLPASEYPLWTAAQALAKPRYHAGSWQKAFGVSQAEMEAVLAAMPRVLNGSLLTREDLAANLAAETGLTHLRERLNESWGSVLKPLAFAGVLIFGPNDGRAVRFTSPDHWLGQTDAIAPDEAFTTILRRYLHTYGPATREEIHRWFGALTPAQIERRLRLLGDEVTVVEVDGKRAWALTADVNLMAAMTPTGTVRLLPAFDQYVVTAPRDEIEVLPEAMRDRVYRTQGWFSPVIVRDGRMIGTWRHDVDGTKLKVEIEPFHRLTPGVKDQIADEADRVARYLDGNLSLTFASPP